MTRLFSDALSYPRAGRQLTGTLSLGEAEA